MKFLSYLIMSLILAGFALAIVPTGVPNNGWDTPVYSDTPPSEDSQNALFELIEETGVLWTGRWNQSTGLPHTLFSNGYPFPVSGEADFQSKCLDFVDSNPAIFGSVGSNDLEQLSITHRNDVWYAIFAQFKDGIRVEGARVDFRVKHGNLVMLGARVIPNLETIGIPGITELRAVSIAQNNFEFQTHTAELIYLAHADGRPVWKINGQNSSPVRNWAIYIDAETGEILYSFDETKTLVSGTVTADVHNMYGTDTPESRAQRYIYVGIGGYTADTSDEAGSYEIEIDPGTGWDISGRLEGLFAKAIPVGVMPAEIFTPADSSIVDLYFSHPTVELDETDAYYHINAVHAWVKTLEPEFTGMDYQVPVYVREMSSPGPNNAWWDGHAVHMGAGAGGYDNWGYYADVYYHEYGHGITDRQYPPGTLPYTGQSGAIDEACSDYTGCTITDESQMGEGGLIPGGGIIRDMDNSYVFPDDWAGEVHADGRIIGGAFWEVRVAVGSNIADTLIHFAKYGAPEEFEAFLDEVLIVDDDDGNLLNGTPHFFEIFTAFQNHGIGQFKVSIYHRPLADSENLDGPYIAKCFVASTLPPAESNIKLTYSNNGGTDWNDVFMSSTGLDREFSCEIPGTGSSAEFWYYITACDTVGICGTEPDSAPPSYHSFFVGTDTLPPIIVHTPLTPVAVSGAPYRVAFTAKDNLALDKIYLIWNINGADNDTIEVTADSLGNCIAFINPTSLSVGDSIGYYIVAIDSAASSNITHHPETGYHWADVVRALWFDFESTDGDFSETEGWEWGIPATEIGAFSGDKCWATGLHHNYVSNANYVLETEPFDLSDWNSAALEFQTYYDSEHLYDGGNVWVSSDGGMRWYVLTPLGGYPTMWVDALREPGWAGNSGGWKKKTFDLTPYMGTSYGHLRFRFVFKSNGEYNLPGWFIDDFALLERQIILPPARLIAESAHDGMVPIHWKKPDPAVAEETRSPLGLLGYNVYRADSMGHYSTTPINSAPIADTIYYDTDVVNEITYYYRITAVYDEGESEPTSEVSATPFNARMSVWPESLYIEVTQGPDLFDTTITITNVGDGWLEFDVIELTYRPDSYRSRPEPAGNPAEILDVLRKMWDAGLINPPASRPMVPPSGDAWRFLHRDPSEFWVSRDIRDLYAQHNTSNFWMKLDSYGPLGEPGDEYAIVFAFDTDLDPSTGSPEFFGVEYVVATGELGFPVDGVILKYDPTTEFGFDIAGFPHWVVNTFDSVGIGIAKTDIEDPPSANIRAAIISNIMTTPIPEDVAPDLDDPAVLYVLADAWWLSQDPISGEATSGSPAEVTVTVEVPYMAVGEYNAWLRIESNDNVDPDRVIPVVCKINPVGVDEVEKPVRLSLENPMPNPFNSACKLHFSTPGGPTAIEVYDIAGRKIRTLYEGDLPSGRYSTIFDGKDSALRELPTGVYFAKLTHEEGDIVKKILLVK